MIGAQSDSIGTGAGDSESVAGDKSSGSATRISYGVKSVSGSIATESAASVAGSIPPSLDGAIGSELRVGANAGAASGVLFGGFALRANSLGHLEQIESYAPGHQVRFGSLNYTANIRGDLIFDGFKPLPSASHGHDEHDLALPSDSV